MLGILLLGLLTIGTLAGPALATEGGGEFTEYSEIRENATDIGAQFLQPDLQDAERAGFFDWIIYPVAALGVVAAVFVILQYLIFQPRFAREAEERAAKR